MNRSLLFGLGLLGVLLLGPRKIQGQYPSLENNPPLVAPERTKVAYPLSIPVPKGSQPPLYEQMEVIARDGARLVVHRWMPAKAPLDQPVVIFLPGIGMHGEPYGAVAAGYTSRQISLVVPDLRGHGRSQGKHGKIPEPALARSDLGEVIGLVNRRYPASPIFLAGESMGGLLAADYAVRGERRLAGLILLVPAFKLHPSQLKGAGEFLTGRVSLTTEAKLKPSTHDPGFIQARRNDPLALNEVESPYLSALGFRQLEWPPAAAHLKMPLFIGVAGQDEIVNNRINRAVFDQAGTPNYAKTWRQWDEARHTICWDPLTPVIVSEVAQWVLDMAK